MDLDDNIREMVEHHIWEYSRIAHRSITNYSSGFHGYCLTLRESIIDGEPTPYQSKAISFIMRKTNKIYSLPQTEFGEIFSEFFIEEKWTRYVINFDKSE